MFSRVTLLITILRLAESLSGWLVLVPVSMRWWKVMLLLEELPILMTMLLELSLMSTNGLSPVCICMGMLQVMMGSAILVVITWKRRVSLVALPT